MKSVSGENWVKMKTVREFEGVRAQAANFISVRETPRHVHHEYVFSLAVKGAWEIDCGHCGATHLFQKGDLLLTEAHEIYASRALGKAPWRHLSIGISKEKIVSLIDPDAFSGRARLPHFERGRIKNGRLRRLFLALYDAVDEDRTGLEQETTLLNWVSEVTQTCAAGSLPLTRRLYRETAAVRRVREFITENFAAGIKLRDLSELVGLSPFHLNRSFAAQVGVPPHVFQNQLRIERAGRLLAQKKSFAEIAFEIGFADQSHFTRFFKRYTGVTPKNFLAL